MERGASELWSSGEPHLAAYLAGSLGWLWDPLASFHAATPASWAGHVWQAARLEPSPVVPADAVWPGPEPARPALDWADTLVLEDSHGSAWWGWHPGFVRARSEVIWPREGRTAAMLSLRNGSFAEEAYGLSIVRADSVRGFSWVVSDRQHPRRGGLARAGDRFYAGSAFLSRWGQKFSAHYLNRASAALLAGLEEERLEGEAGGVAWESSAPFGRLAAQVGRERGANQSFGSLLYSRRETQAWWGEARLEPGRGAWQLRGDWRRPTVERFAASEFAPRVWSEWWVAASRAEPTPLGSLHAALGFGQHAGLDRYEVAPAIEWAPARGTWLGSLWMGRELEPVWGDVPPAAGFLQDTWAGGAGVRWRPSPAASQARVALTVGRTRHRALLARRPLVEEWLRAGVVESPDLYDFGLLSTALVWQGRSLGAGLDGAVLARDRTAAQPRVDPPHVGSAWLEGRGRLFAGDLALGLRVELHGVGPRESEDPPSQRLEGYVQLDLALTARLGDALLVLRELDVADVRPQWVWRDHATGELARAPGQRVVLSFDWRLFD